MVRSHCSGNGNGKLYFPLPLPSQFEHHYLMPDTYFFCCCCRHEWVLNSSWQQWQWHKKFLYFVIVAAVWKNLKGLFTPLEATAKAKNIRKQATKIKWQTSKKMFACNQCEWGLNLYPHQASASAATMQVDCDIWEWRGSIFKRHNVDIFQWIQSDAWLCHCRWRSVCLPLKVFFWPCE